MILVFLTFSLKLSLSLSSFTLIKRLFNSSSLSAISMVLYAYLGEGNGTPLQYSCLENPMGGGLPSMGSHRVGHDRSDLAAAAYAYLRLLIFPPAILIPAYESSSLAFLMMYSAYSRKNIYLCFIDYAKAFDCVDRQEKHQQPQIYG